MAQRGEFDARVVDRFIGLVALIIVLPTLLWVGWLVGVTGGSPVFCKDSVITPDGSVGDSYRFRTTGQGTRAFAFVGRILRKWSLDELPSFWSVAFGKLRLSEALKAFRRHG
jgi:lipopolysaccharide/colanic/teichoic acid biosynthesis glycosyltransferase